MTTKAAHFFVDNAVVFARAPKHLLGWLVGAALVLAAFLGVFVYGDTRVMYGTAASLITGLATAVGAAPILIMRTMSRKAQDAMLGFGAGVMLAAAAFSLILPGIEAAEALWHSRMFAAVLAATGIAAGALFLRFADRVIPHRHFEKGNEGPSAHRVKQVWLFVLAVTLHNFPEGLAVGVGFGAGSHAEAAGLAAGIGIQNMPEGLAVALALASVGYSRIAAFSLAAATGLAEPIAGLFGAAIVAYMQLLLPFALTFAAGAMLFVISHEIIPESHRNGHEQSATLGVIGGFIVMMLLDIALG